MPEILSNCPVCQSSSIKPTLKCIDYTVTQEEFEIYHCQSCNFKFTNPRPGQTEINRYYESENYISHSGTQKGFINKLYHIVREFTLKRKLHLINHKANNKQKTILDIGCGTGAFLKTCKANGWIIKGVEPDEKTREIASAYTGSEIGEDIFGVRDEKFSIITMWHVLEHVHDLNSNIKDIKNLLAADGKLIVAVPNHKSYDAEVYTQYWAAYDVPRHLSHFNIESIKALMTRNNLKVSETKGMVFDSFYISMLSSKYKSGYTNYFSAFFIGLISNIKGMINQNYSSIIYIISKND